MTTIYTSAANGEFLVTPDTTGDLDFRLSNSNVGITITSNAEITFSNVAIQLPTANVSSPEVGMLRYNTSNNKFEGFNGTSWIEFTY